MRKIALVLFLFIILGGLYFYRNFVPAETNNNPSVTESGGKTINVADQRPGSIINISFASLDKAGYIVIHEDNEGNLGNILGNSRILTAGELTNIQVGLIRPTVNGESLFAVIYEDSGDGIFYPDIDIPIKDELGNIIFVIFRINRNASVVQ